MCSPLLSASSYLHAETVTGLHLYSLRRTRTRILVPAKKRTRAVWGPTCAQTSLEQLLINPIYPLGHFLVFSAAAGTPRLRMDHLNFTQTHSHNSTVGVGRAHLPCPLWCGRLWWKGVLIRVAAGQKLGPQRQQIAGSWLRYSEKPTGPSAVGNWGPQKTKTKQRDRKTGRRQVTRLLIMEHYYPLLDVSVNRKMPSMSRVHFVHSYFMMLLSPFFFFLFLFFKYPHQLLFLTLASAVLIPTPDISRQTARERSKSMRGKEQTRTREEPSAQRFSTRFPDRISGGRRRETRWGKYFLGLSETQKHCTRFWYHISRMLTINRALGIQWDDVLKVPHFYSSLRTTLE